MNESRKKSFFLALSFAGPDQRLETPELLFDTYWTPNKEKAITQKLCEIWLSS